MPIVRVLATPSNSSSPKTKALKRNPRISPVAATRIVMADIAVPRIQRCLKAGYPPRFFFGYKALIFPWLYNIARCDFFRHGPNADGYSLPRRLARNIAFISNIMQSGGDFHAVA